MATTQITDATFLLQTETILHNKDLLGLVLPKHLEFNPDRVTRLPMVTGATVATVLDGDPIPVTDMKISEVKLEAKKRATIMVLSKELVTRSPEGAINFLVNNIEQAITTEAFKDLEALSTDTATKIGDGLAKVAHLAGGGIIYLKDIALVNNMTLPEGWTFKLAPITAKWLIVPDFSTAVTQRPLELTEDVDAVVNMQGDAGIATGKVVSLFQQNFIGVRVIKFWDIKSLAAIIKAA